MSGDHAQGCSLEIKVYDHRASRLQAGQADPPDAADNAVSRKDNVAVPSMVLGVLLHMNRRQVGGVFEGGQINKATPISHPPVGLLQGNQIGVDLADDLGDPTRVEDPVGPNAFVDIVGSDRGAGGIVMELDMLRRLFAKSIDKRSRKRRRAGVHGSPSMEEGDFCGTQERGL